MFWKLLISILLLPSCLGFEVASASIKNEVQTLPKSEELESFSQKQVNQNVVSLSPTLTEYSSISSDRKSDSSELQYKTLNQPYLIAHHYNDCYHQGNYRHSYNSYHHYYHPQRQRYYLRGFFYPDNVQYHRSYEHHNYYRPSGYRHYYHNYYRPSGYRHYYHNYSHPCGGYCGHSNHGYY
ncbi:MAG: hypothetical protein PUP93_11265 [Rhizonema sp. NSF051]|nr:hypothetical protein [Rhizonema sp. NSF051]